MNLSTVKWAPWDKNHSRELLGPFICVCIALCTIVAHNIARNRPDNFPSYPPDNHHCSDDVYLREGVWNLEMLEIAEVAFTVAHGHCYGVLFSRLHIIMPSPSVLWHCWLGGRKGIRPVKNWMVGFWRGYLSMAKCRFAYGPADATATHCLLLQ